jgi:hypothetical protein
MARNAADAARSTRPKGEDFSVSLRMFHAEVSVTNRTGWKSRIHEFNPSVEACKALYYYWNRENKIFVNTV